MMSEREDRRLLKVSIAFIIGLVTIGIIVANIRYLDLGERSQIGGPEIKEIILALIYSLGSIWAIVFVVYLLRRKPSIQAEHQKEHSDLRRQPKSTFRSGSAFTEPRDRARCQ